ncbi:hypothetical protein METBIDRAFT_110417 [Metschnikowia bicuspidata var. bicuspidata NRRL YB-4993]|uniref:Uncharacterized protein n=1 Tax=Metschnikowia bicuspidata var. bicuspidata NRRL YB-4993 TaxID=869754 RepID=A0A1A0HI36_9ASCO|nr:hypothetical protein METBIDRAFT_110417 [Metschnikowia bicuspidata var. bicuspidata NRRL YB-4993]OBA23666.1 hypothetical protein METBIDRAFT_110417 [Metschnikowia bicuspidata var. bicuspidata NRRL YB-4993]
MNEYILWVLALLLCWKVAWIIIYYTSGLYVGYVSINNGVLLNNFKLHRGIQISASSVRWRLWGNTKKVVISDLNVIVPLRVGTVKSKPRGRTMSDSPITIFPSSKLSKWAIKSLLFIVRRVDLELKDPRFGLEKFVADAKSLLFVFHSQKSLESSSIRDIHCLASALQARVRLLHSGAQTSLLRIGTLSTLLSTSVNTHNGLLSNVVTKLYVDEAELNMLHIIRTLVTSLESCSRGGSNTPTTKVSLESKLSRFTTIHRKFSPCFKECSINIVSFCAQDIPVIPSVSDCSLSEYLNLLTAGDIMYTSVDAASIHFQRLLPTSAGFDIHFSSAQDLPIHITFSSLLFKAGFEWREAIGDFSSSYGSRNELISIPNFSFTLKTNAARHLVDGFGFKNSIFEIFLSVNSPTLDIDHHQLAILAHNFTVWGKIITERKLRQKIYDKHHENLRLSASKTVSGDERRNIRVNNTQNSPSQSCAPQTLRKDLMFDRAIVLLKDYFPKLNAKVTVEQPRVLIRVQNPDLAFVQMLMVSYSLMVVHILTTKKRDYNIECQFIHPNVTFSEKSDMSCFTDVLHVEICGLGDANLKFHIMKDLKIKTKVQINGSYIDLTKPDVLNGLHDIIDQTSCSITKTFNLCLMNARYDQTIHELRNQVTAICEQQGEKSGHDLQTFLFRYIPSWLVSFDFKLLNIELRVGSASPLLPLDYISELSNLVNKTFDQTDRVVCLEMSDLTISVDDRCALRSKSFQPVVLSSFASTIPQMSSQDLIESYWSVSSEISNLKLSFINESERSPIISLPSIRHNTNALSRNSKDELSQEVTIKLVDINFDRQKLFVMIGLIYLINETVVMPLKKLHLRIKKETHTLKPVSKSYSKRHLLDYTTLSFKIENVDFVLSLSTEFKVRLQFYTSRIGYSNGIVTVTNKFLRAMVISSSLAGHWDRVLCVDSLHAKIGDTTEDYPINLLTSAIRFIQPHGFVVYKLFDNLSVFLKIAKHLVSCFRRQKKETFVFPTESKPVVSVGIKLTSAKISLNIEDDPFESELNMIYQLGLVEQRKRLEHLNILDEQCRQKLLSETDCSAAFSSLQKAFERLWIRKVETYKEELSREVSENKKYLFGDELDVSSFKYDKLRPYPLHAPLLSVSLIGVQLNILKPEFSLQNLPDFLYQHGQGVPRGTRYNLMIPTFIKLNLEELRMHLRDYPLPLLHLPYSKNHSDHGTALSMSGHLIICEALVLDKAHLRTLEVELTDKSNKTNRETTSFDKLTIQKSLSTVKLYTDMNIVFGSAQPSRFVWGQSYQFGIQQIMLTVDQFSKPPVDISPKLGFWDKLRLIIHGKISIRTGYSASIEVAFKGGKDPYDLFGESNGFILGFRDSVVWNINQADDSSDLFNIVADKLSWYIPNYPSTKLVCWSRDSSKAVHLPSEKSFITSCYGFYLGRTDSNPVVKDTGCCEKRVVELSGGIKFSVGFLLERFSTGENEFSTTGKPHFEVELHNPEFTSIDHDSFEGFRSDRLHMAIALKAYTKNSYNTIHLSPGVMKQFFSWWKIFQGNMMLPIRKGRLFGEKKSSQKFSKHLFSNKFLFDIGNLFIGHIIQKLESEVQNDYYSCVGLRAKVEHFLVDLHQKKEEIIDVHKDLSRRKKVMKMRFNLGQVSLKNIDLRSISAIFFRDIYQQGQGQKNQSQPLKVLLEIFDNDDEWLDVRDYVECFRPLIGDLKSAKILPLLYSEEFVYMRDTTNGINLEHKSGTKMHKCNLDLTDYKSSEIQLYKRRVKQLSGLPSLQKNHEEFRVSKRIEVLNALMASCKSDRRNFARSDSFNVLELKKEESFHNRFLLVSMFLKWNEQVRNQLMKYIHFVHLNSSHKKFLSFGFMSILEGLIENQNMPIDELSLATSFSELLNRESVDSETPDENQSSQKRYDNFDKIIHQTTLLEDIVENYKIEIVSPQIQLHSEELKDSVIIVTAPCLEAKIVSVVTKKENQPLNDLDVMEKRYGVILHEASLMVIDEKDVKTNPYAFETTPYGTQTKWPPFLGVETCKRQDLASPDTLLAQQMSVMLTFDQPLASSCDTMDTTENVARSERSINMSRNAADKLKIDIPRISINCTSKQYFSLYATILSLMLYIEPLAAELRERVRKLNFSIDFQDFRALRDRLEDLYEYVGITKELLKNYSFRQKSFLDNESLNDYLLLADKKASFEMEIVLMLQILFLGDIARGSLSRVVQDWRIAADDITIRMLNDDRSHIIDLTIDRGVYKRAVKDDGSNDNRIEIMSINGRSLLSNSRFKNFLEPIEPPKDHHLVTIDWSMNKSVGGIKIIDNFDISSLPLNVKIEEETGRLLIRFLFRQNKSRDLSRSPVMGVKKGSRGNVNTSPDKFNVEYALCDEIKLNGKKSTFSKGSDKNISSKESSLATSSKTDLDEDLNSMISRSKKYLSIAKLTSHLFEVMITLRMKNGLKRWLNVTNFLLVLPRWEIQRKVLSLFEVVDFFKSVVVRSLMSHSLRILRNKVTTRLNNLRRYKAFLRNIHMLSLSLPLEPANPNTVHECSKSSK